MNIKSLNVLHDYINTPANDLLLSLIFAARDNDNNFTVRQAIKYMREDKEYIKIPQPRLKAKLYVMITQLKKKGILIKSGTNPNNKPHEGNLAIYSFTEEYVE